MAARRFCESISRCATWRARAPERLRLGLSSFVEVAVGFFFSVSVLPGFLESVMSLYFVGADVDRKNLKRPDNHQHENGEQQKYRQFVEPAIKAVATSIAA